MGMTHPILAFNFPRDELSTTSLGNLFQCFTTLTVRSFFFISDIWAMSSLGVPDCVEWQLSPDVHCQRVPHFSLEQKQLPGTFSFSYNLVSGECKKVQSFISDTLICAVVGYTGNATADWFAGQLGHQQVQFRGKTCLSQSFVTCLAAGERDPSRKCE